MAWDEFHARGVRGMSGDKPLDEWSAALKRVAAAYEEQFQRKPTVAEILQTFETALLSLGERELEDGASLRGCRLELVGGTFVDPPIDAAEYEAAYTEVKKERYYVVERREDGEEVVRVPRLELIDRTLEIDYEILDDSLDEPDARRLVRIALLDVFLDRTYAGEADLIRWCELDSGTIETTDYARRT
jgi:hypothetical protein